MEDPDVGAPNRQIQGIYLWEKLGRERIVQINALLHYGMYTRCFVPPPAFHPLGLSNRRGSLPRAAARAPFFARSSRWHTYLHIEALIE